jgi:hypothetical protein
MGLRGKRSVKSRTLEGLTVKRSLALTVRKLKFTTVRTHVLLRFWNQCFKSEKGNSGVSQSQVKVILGLTVSRPVRLGIRHPSGTGDQFFPFFLWLSFWQFRVCWCWAPSLTRSPVCTFPFLPSIASAAFLRSEFQSVYCLYFWVSSNQEGEVPLFISPSNRVAQLYPGHWVCLINLHIITCYICTSYMYNTTDSLWCRQSQQSTYILNF